MRCFPLEVMFRSYGIAARGSSGEVVIRCPNFGGACVGACHPFAGTAVSPTARTGPEPNNSSLWRNGLHRMAVHVSRRGKYSRVHDRGS